MLFRSAYGTKFVLGLGVSALAIPAAGMIYDVTGGFWWMFVAMAGIGGLVILAGLFLPRAGETAGSPAAAQPPVASPAE